MKNIHVMLPPDFRDLWKSEFQVIKKADVQNGHGWLYEADPFIAWEENEKVEALKRKKRDEVITQKAMEAKIQALPRLSARDPKRSDLGARSKSAKIEMGKLIRSDVEALLRKYIRWNLYCISIASDQSVTIVNELSNMGFRESHVREAVEYCKDREEVLEWLLIHVPEDDLPVWAMPENYSAGVSLVSGNIAKEAKVARLSQAGYSIELCQALLEKHGGSELDTSEALQHILCEGLSKPAEASCLTLSGEHGEDIWTQELDTLESIFGDRFSKIDALGCSLKLHLAGLECSVQFRRSRAYPLDAPLLRLIGNGVPAYIKLSIYRQAIRQAYQAFLGQPMVYLLVDWLEIETPRIVAEPGKLRDIATAAIPMVAAHPQISNTKRLPARDIKSRGRRAAGSAKSLSILRQWCDRQNQRPQVQMMAARQTLPAWGSKEKILKAVDENQVTIIGGPTGSGKSTQTVQFILDDMIQNELGEYCSIICTQPRRISALGLAERVAEERCVTVGEEVGYTIRGESRQTPGKTSITFCTTGVLLRKLQVSSFTAEDLAVSLEGVSHVVVDEVHERSLDTDFLLILLRDILPSRKDLKLILMSATLDAVEFETYFQSISTVGKVEVEGRTFPVTDYYLDDAIKMSQFNDSVGHGDLDDREVGRAIKSVGTRINYELIAAVVHSIHHNLGKREGSILIFLPGVAEINRTIDALRGMHDIHPLPLHASLAPAEQRRVFFKAPNGQRKVVAATNVAETSITIPDCVAVVDTGHVKETTFDTERSMVKLEEVWASQASCKQRRGRAGRVAAGECFKLYTRNAEAKMPLRPEPEIRRVPLEQLCLSIRAMGITDVNGFLAKALTKPERTSVEGAMTLLCKIGALDSEGKQLTALGRHLASIPSDLRCGKLMIYGALFGCMEATLTIASILTIRSPFLSPQTKRDESKAVRTSFAEGHGDLIADLEAYKQWTARRQSNNSTRDIRVWCDQSFLSHQTLSEISTTRIQYLSSLKEAGFIPADYYSYSGSASNARYPSININGSNLALLRALIAGAFNPQIARIAFPDKKFAASSSGAVELDPEARTIKYFTEDAGRVFVHPSSTLFEAQGFPGHSMFMAYFSRMATSKVFIRNLTPFNSYSLLMFAGSVRLDTMGKGLIVDEWLKFRSWARIGALVGRLRTMLDEILDERMENPGNLSDKGQEVLAVVRRLIEFDGLDR